MLEEWTHLPRWLKFGTAAAVLGYSTYWAFERGVFFGWGFGMGGLLLIMSFMKPLGPPRRKTPSAPLPDTSRSKNTQVDSWPPYPSLPEDAQSPATMGKRPPTRNAGCARSGDRSPGVLDGDWHRPPPREGFNPRWALVGGLVLALFAVLSLLVIMW
jgi:hypothetical protein